MLQADHKFASNFCDKRVIYLSVCVRVSFWAYLRVGSIAFFARQNGRECSFPPVNFERNENRGRGVADDFMKTSDEMNCFPLS